MVSIIALLTLKIRHADQICFEKEVRRRGTDFHAFKVSSLDSSVYVQQWLKRLKEAKN